MNVSRWMAVVTLLLLLAPPAHARRHLLAIAAHRGSTTEEPLRFAGRDAERLIRVFSEVGGLSPVDAVLLVDPSLSDVESALSVLAKERVQPTDTLIVYASAHMDDQAIHLGPERLTFEQLFSSSRATAASLRVFILDGCRSGSVTLKGTERLGPARMIRPELKPAVGEVILSATSPNEDALESDRLAGSFFTHFLIAGLRGAADRDGDGQVSMEEILRFSHAMTVYATAGSPIGPQHPAFKIDLSGNSPSILTEPGQASNQLARFRVGNLGDGALFLLHESTNLVEAEVFMSNPVVLVVPSGAYRVRVASARRVQEGRAQLEAGVTTDLEQIQLDTVPLLHLIRKGEASARSRPMIRLEVLGGAADIRGFTPSIGVAVTGSLEWRTVSLSLELSHGYNQAENANIGFSLNRFSIAFGISHSLVLGPISLAFGLSLEGTLAHELFEPRRPGVETKGNRTALRFGLVPIVRVDLPTGNRFVPSLTLRGRVVFDSEFDARFVPILGLGAGWVF